MHSNYYFIPIPCTLFVISEICFLKNEEEKANVTAHAACAKARTTCQRASSVKLTADRAIWYGRNPQRSSTGNLKKYTLLTVSSAFRPASFECRRWKPVTLENIVDTIMRLRCFTGHLWIEYQSAGKPQTSRGNPNEKKKSFDTPAVTVRLHGFFIVSPIRRKFR